MQLLVPHTVEPLTAQDKRLRQHLRLEADETEQDAVIDGYAEAARGKVESFTRLALMTQTVRFVLDQFCPSITLPVSPVQSVENVEYLDEVGDWQTVPPEEYRLLISRSPNVLCPAYGNSWPVARGGGDAVRIDVVLGFGDDPEALPSEFLQAMRAMVAHMYYEREGDPLKEVDDLLFSHVFWA